MHEARGQFWCSVGAQPGIPGRLLVSYSHDLQVPMDDVEWDGSASSLIPASGVDGLSSIHRELLDAWLQTVNLTNRLSHVIEVLPSFAIRARDCAGVLRMVAFHGCDGSPGLDQAKDVVVRWHSSGGRNDRTNASGTDPHQPLARLRRGRLIPLKNLVNHHPNGADQSPIPNRTAVITAGNSDANQTYECYGERDAFQLLMHHGYVEQQAPLVHSVPVEVAVPGVGRVRVLSMPRRHSDARTRAMRRHGRPQPPEIVVRDGSWNIRSMTFRPRTRSTECRPARPCGAFAYRSERRGLARTSRSDDRRDPHGKRRLLPSVARSRGARTAEYSRGFHRGGGPASAHKAEPHVGAP